MKQKLKVFESFSGYGSQRMALRNLGIEFESVGISEIDIPAVLSYASIHDGLDKEDESFVYPSKEEMIKYLEQRNIGLDFKTKKIKLPKNLIKLQQIYRATVLSKCFGDISLIDPINLPDMDLFTYSFPCTDISVAGQQQGVIKGQTRSGLLYECEKIIEVKRPKYLLMENVKNLVGKKFKEQFDEWLKYLESLGYTNYWQVLNAKDYGVPQNRERVFAVSILNDEDKDYVFPTPKKLEHDLYDVLDETIDSSCMITDKMFTYVLDLNGSQSGTKWTGRVDSAFISPKIASTISVRGAKGQRAGVSNIISLSHREPINVSLYKESLVSNKNNNDLRNLSPKECWRLMGCSDEDFEKAKLFNPDSQLYKQAGNSIVVNVLEGIFANMFCKE